LCDAAAHFVRVHKTLRVTPAMAAGVTRLSEMGDVVDVLEAWETVKWVTQKSKGD
jgi:hypothetical protein